MTSLCVGLNEVDVRVVPFQVSHSSSLSVSLGFSTVIFISEEMQISGFGTSSACFPVLFWMSD